MLRSSLQAFLLSLCVLVFPKLAPAAPLDTPGAAALTNWQVALSSFQKAGAFIGQGKYAQAKTELASSTTNLPAPYGNMASEYRTRLEGALKQSSKDQRVLQLQAFVELCAELRAYPAAVQLMARLRKADPDDAETVDQALPWRLLESGDVKAALAKYQRKETEEHVEMWKSYYRKQIDLIRRRPTNLANVEFATEYVREHYLTGYEEKADAFSALKELSRSLPHAKNAKETLAVYQFIIKNLVALDDEPGIEAWENKVLSEFKSDREASAGVILDRGLRAYTKKDYPGALAIFRKICSEYPDTLAYGDAQYDAGLVLHDQQKYAEAIAEYDRLFLSQVNDAMAESSSSEDAKNYRYKAALRISECYESQKDYARALQYAELARDRYKFIGWCKICIDSARTQLEARIGRIEALAKPAAK